MDPERLTKLASSPIQTDSAIPPSTLGSLSHVLIAPTKPSKNTPFSKLPSSLKRLAKDNLNASVYYRLQRDTGPYFSLLCRVIDELVNAGSEREHLASFMESFLIHHTATPEYTHGSALLSPPLLVPISCRDKVSSFPFLDGFLFICF